jgi:hypothetical protein
LLVCASCGSGESTILLKQWRHNPEVFAVFILCWLQVELDITPDDGDDGGGDDGVPPDRSLLFTSTHKEVRNSASSLLACSECSDCEYKHDMQHCSLSSAFIKNFCDCCC